MLRLVASVEICHLVAQLALGAYEHACRACIIVAYPARFHPHFGKKRFVPITTYTGYHQPTKLWIAVDGPQQVRRLSFAEGQASEHDHRFLGVYVTPMSGGVL